MVDVREHVREHRSLCLVHINKVIRPIQIKGSPFSAIFSRERRFCAVLRPAKTRRKFQFWWMLQSVFFSR